MEAVVLLVVMLVILPIWALVAALSAQRRVGELEREVRVLRQLQARPADPPSAPVVPPAPLQRPLVPTQDVSLDGVNEPGPEHPGEQLPVPLAADTAQRRAPPFSQFAHWLTGFFSGPSAFARIGAVVFLIGVGLGLRYAADLGLLGLSLRLWGVVTLGAALFVLGWRLRRVRAAYAAALMGTAFGVWYLTVFASLRFYDLLASGVAFALLALLGTGLALLAGLQRSQVLAVLGTLGGFLAPVLSAGQGGEGSGLQLFAYYALLNAMVLPLGARFGWGGLPLLGFVATFGLGSLWGVLSYRPEAFAVAEPFLLLFFLMYALLPLAEERLGPARPGGAALGLMIATPVVFLSLQAALVGGERVFMALSCLGLSVFYGVLSAWSRPWRGAHVALAVGSLTLGLPFALGLDLTPAAWALQGSALAWFAVRTRSPAWSAWSVLVQAAAALAVVWNAHSSGAPGPLEGWGLAALLALAALLSARFLRSVTRRTADGLAAWSVLLWLLGGAYGLLGSELPGSGLALLLVYAAGSSLLLAPLGARWVLRLLGMTALLPLPLALLALPAWLGTSPLADWGWLSAPVVVAAQLALLEWRAVAFPLRLRPLFHALIVWFVLLILAWSAASAWGGVWAVCAWGGASALGVVFVLSVGRFLPWIERDFAALVRVGVLPLVGFGLLWFVLASFSSGGGAAWQIPLFNPLDLTLAASWLVAWRVLTHVGARRTPGLLQVMQPVWRACRPRTAVGLLSVCALLGSSTAALRGVHLLGGVPWEAWALLSSGAVQTALSLVWTALGMGAMWWASRFCQPGQGAREAWLAGAALLGLVTLKLFLVDLAGSSAPARVVSFVTVGALLLLIGYVSPAPPRDRAS